MADGVWVSTDAQVWIPSPLCASSTAMASAPRASSEQGMVGPGAAGAGALLHGQAAACAARRSGAKQGWLLGLSHSNYCHRAATTGELDPQQTNSVARPLCAQGRRMALRVLHTPS